MIRLYEEFNTKESDELIESINHYLARISKFIDRRSADYTELQQKLSERLNRIPDDETKDEIYKVICSRLDESLKYFKTLYDVLGDDIYARNLDRYEWYGRDSIIDILTDANKG